MIIRKVKETFKWSLLLCLLYISSACSHQRASIPALDIEVIHHSNNCDIEKPVIKTIDSAAELSKLLQSMPKKFGLGEMFEPDINYENKMLILYGLGQKPSSGYGIELYQTNASLIEGKLHLPIRVTQPVSGMMQAQLLTSPCAIYLLPRVEYSEIVIDSGLAE